MLSFRFHIVSLVAVFLALGIGILMGTTVVNDFTIDTLETQIADARSDVNRYQDEINALEEDLDDIRARDEQYLAESLPLLVADRLPGQPVMIIAADGIDRDPLGELQAAFATAGAAFQGTIWLDERMALSEEDDVAEAARMLDRFTTTNPEGTRQALILRLASELVQPGPADPGPGAEGDAAPEEPAGTLLLDLVTAGFVDYQPPSGSADDPILPAPGTWFVVVGGRGSAVDGEAVLEPLLRAIAVEGITAPAVAAEGEDPEGEDGEEPEVAAPFVGPLRDEETTAERVSTVDNIDLAAGRAAVVFALQQLQDGVVGHYGVADGAQRLLPAPVPAS